MMLDVSKNSNTWKIILGIALSAIFLYFAVRGVELTQFLSSFSRIIIWPAVAGLILAFASLFLRGYRWKLILDMDVKVFHLFEYNSLGWALNFVLPARAGEVVKAVIAGEECGESKTFMLGTVAVARLFDILSVLMVLVFSALFLDIGIPREIYYLGIGIIISGFISIIVSHRYPESIESLTYYLPTPARDIIQPRIKTIIGGLTTIDSPYQFISVIAISMLVWILTLLSYSAFLTAFGISSSLAVAGIVVGVLSLGIALPSGPGYIGHFQYFIVVALTAVGVARDMALAASVFLYGMEYILAILLGAPLLLKYGGTTILR